MSRVIGLNLNQNGWGFVELTGAGSSEKIGLVQKGEWHSSDNGARGTELRRIWLEYRLPRRAMISLPVYHGVLTTLTLPPLPERDIPAAIRGALDYSVASGEDWLAFDIINRAEKLKVRVGVLNAAEMAPWGELLEAAGIEPEGFVLQASAASGVLATDEGPSVLALASDDKLEIGLAVSGALALWRVIPLRRETEETEILRELSLTRLAWAKEGGKEAVRIIALGFKASDETVCWEESWGAQRLSLTRGKTYFDGELSLISAYGAARSVFSGGIVWRPEPASKIRRERYQTVSRFIVAAFLLMAGVFFFYLAHYRGVEEEKRWVQEHRSLYRELEAVQHRDEQILGTMEKKRRLWEERHYYSRYLTEWQKAVPEGTVLSSWSMEGTRVLELTGRTPSVTLLLKRLAKDRRFRDLMLKGPIIHNPKGWDEFRMSGKLTKGVGACK